MGKGQNELKIGCWQMKSVFCDIFFVSQFFCSFPIWVSSSQKRVTGSYSLPCLFVCFVALRPKSTAMVIAGQSVHLTTLFPGQA